ncbi:MAG: hypothetical protein QW570_09165 [Candidatus Caldarchaeum sp.]
MTVASRLVMAGIFFAGVALGILIRLDEQHMMAQDHDRKVESAQVLGWKITSLRPNNLPWSRETREFVCHWLSKLSTLDQVFDEDYLFEQHGEKSRPKARHSRDLAIWSFTQAKEAVARACPGCPPGGVGNPHLAIPEPRFRYFVEDVYTVNPDHYILASDVPGFAKPGDRIYVVRIEELFMTKLKMLSSLFWVNARTGEVAVLVPPSQKDALRKDVRIIIPRSPN